MALLDNVIREVEQKFGLGNKAAAFIAETVRYLFASEQGGLRGILERFKAAGLGDVAASWVAKGKENLPLTGGQVEEALGSRLITRLGSLFSLPDGNIRDALATVIPKLVDLLTPDGFVPNGLPADIQAFLNSSAARFRPTAAAAGSRDDRDKGGASPWGWVAALLWSGLLAYWAFTGPEEVAKPTVAAVQPKANLPARLALSNTDGKIEFSGVVGDEKTRTSILDQLRAAFGAPNISGKVDVDPRVGPATWLTNLGALLKQFKLPGADLLLEGNGIKVGGWLSDADRSSLLGSIKSLLGSGFSFGLLGDKANDAAKAAYAKTLSALDSLKPGSSASDVANALNLWVINFATDSAEIPADSQPIIARAAKAINAAPEAVVIEIDGYTDNIGDSTANQKLSESRAVAIVEALAAAGVPKGKLKAHGHGSERPVASNDTAYGRFRNRRIEFQVQQ
jgi:OOP family OmpA-OmpF porin